MKKSHIVLIVIVLAIGALVLAITLTVDYGEVSVEGSGVTLKMNAAFWWTTLKGGADPRRVHAGTYKPTSIVVTSETENGEHWTIASHGPWGDLKKVAVKGGGQMRLKVGPPFVLGAIPAGAGSVVLLSFAIHGQSGERYEPVMFKGRELAKLPTFEIVSETGKVLSTGKFEYG